MFTIEPILLEGALELAMFDDNWTCATVDGMRAAQQEHTLLVTEDVSHPSLLPPCADCENACSTAACPFFALRDRGWKF